jgi:hypothetical protein
MNNDFSYFWGDFNRLLILLYFTIQNYIFKIFIFIFRLFIPRHNHTILL